MDPNALLFQLREAIERLDDASDDERAAIHSDITHDFRELDAWITKGGFLPAVWSEAQRRALENTREPVRVKDVDEMLDLLEPDPWHQRERARRDVNASTVVFGFNVRGDA